MSGQARGAAGRVSKNPAQLARLCFLNFCDIGCALAVALVVNVSVLLVSAATFHTQGVTRVLACGVQLAGHEFL